MPLMHPPPSAEFAGRRTVPRPEDVRFAFASLLLLGFVGALPGALLPSWAARLSFDTERAGEVFLGLGLGAALGAAIGLKGPLREASAARRLVQTASAAAACSLFLLPSVYEPRWLGPSLAGMGLAVGALAAVAVQRLRTPFPAGRALQLFDLGSVAFRLGGAAGCALVWLGSGVSDGTLRAGGVALLVVAVLAAFGQPAPRASKRPPSRFDRSASTRLVELTLLLQAALHGVLAGWLALYLARRLGLAPADSVAALGLLWLSAVAGRLAGARLAAADKRARALTGAGFSGLLGLLFLLNAADLVGSFGGAALTGFGCGMLLSATLAAAEAVAEDSARNVLSRVAGPGAAIAAVAAWAVVPATRWVGLSAVIWLAAGALVAALGLLAVLLAETHLSRALAARSA